MRIPSIDKGQYVCRRSFSGAKTDAGKADEAAGLTPGNEDNAASICFSPEKPCCPLSIEGIISKKAGARKTAPGSLRLAGEIYFPVRSRHFSGRNYVLF